MKVREFLKGKKTYIIGGLSIILGIYTKNSELISSGFVAFGLRAALSNEIANTLTKEPKKDVVAETETIVSSQEATNNQDEVSNQ